MTYRRIERPSDLPTKGIIDVMSRERGDLDFKRFADPARSWEHAKDIAAFANSIGGVILVGADSESGRLEFPGIKGQTAAELKSIYEGAAQLCSPAPTVDVVPIPLSTTKSLVAVNVDAYPEQLVAAPAGTRDRNGLEKKHDKAWVFPIRRASQTDYIEPENLAMYMNQSVRRAVLLLARIPQDARTAVTVHYNEIVAETFGTRRVVPTTLAIGEVCVERNYLELIEHEGASRSIHCHVPLTDVFDAWPAKNGRWQVRVRGRFQHVDASNGRTLEYQVLP